MQVVDPQAQAVAIDIVRQIVPDAQVGTFYPQDAPELMVVVSRVGGRMLNTITDQATLSIQCYAESEFGAEVLAGRVRLGLNARGFMGTRVRGVLVRNWAESSAPQRLTDPDARTHVRFQFSGQLTLSMLRPR